MVTTNSAMYFNPFKRLQLHICPLQSNNSLQGTFPIKIQIDCISLLFVWIHNQSPRHCDVFCYTSWVV